MSVQLEEFQGLSTDPRLLTGIQELGNRYLAFLWHAFNPEQHRFRNFMSYDRRWLEEVGSEDSHGRALWALGTAIARSKRERLGDKNDVFLAQGFTNLTFGIRRDDDHGRSRLAQSFPNALQNVDNRRFLADDCQRFGQVDA